MFDISMEILSLYKFNVDKICFNFVYRSQCCTDIHWKIKAFTNIETEELTGFAGYIKHRILPTLPKKLEQKAVCWFEEKERSSF